MSKSIAQHLEGIQKQVQQENYYQTIINRLIDVMDADHDIHVGETPPPKPELGDVWYKPSEDRYYHWVI